MVVWRPSRKWSRCELEQGEDTRSGHSHTHIKGLFGHCIAQRSSVAAY